MSSVPWWLIALATTALIWAFTHYGVQLSARITALLGGLELLIMLALGITFLVHPGPGSNYLAPLTPSSSPHGFGGILAGMVFSILALSGFEAPAPLAQEARRPAKFIGQAIMLSLVSIGVFYIFTSYASAIGWGTGNMAAFASNANPYYVLGHRLWGAALVVRRSRHHQQRRQRRSRLHQLRVARDVHDGPGRHASSKFRACPSPASDADVRNRLCADRRNGGNPAGRLAAARRYHLRLPRNHRHACGHRALRYGEFGLDALHALANSGPTLVSGSMLVAPWVATLALLPVLFVTVYPEPVWPYNITPYLFLIALLVGFAYMQWREWRNPGALQRGATMLIRAGSEAQDEAEGSQPVGDDIALN